MKKKKKKKNYLNKQICKKCGGHCCKTMPGAATPDDFEKPLLQSLTKAFKSGKWSIDWWEDAIQEYFIRPATKHSVSLYDPSYGGECVFLEGDCKLGDYERPIECRMLEPGKKGCKKHGVDRETLSKQWLPFYDIIKEAAKLSQL